MKAKTQTFVITDKKESPTYTGVTDFLTKIGKDNLITLTESNGYVTVWYWSNQRD